MSEPRRLRPHAPAVVPLSAHPSLLPSARSVVIALAVAAVAALAYVAARETSAFAVRSIVVVGAPADVAADVRAALGPLSGRSLVSLRADDIVRLATAVPDVESVSYDRAFPHTLRVSVRLERPLAVARRGPLSWLVSRTGRVIRTLPRGSLPALPRIWEPQGASIVVGAPLPAEGGADEVAALAPVRDAGLLGRIASVRRTARGLTYVVRGGPEVRVGSDEMLLLKLTVAQRILAQTPRLAYLDVSVPERPVATRKAQVSG